MKAYSEDLRIRLLAALDGGMSVAPVAPTFQSSVSSIRRWPAQQTAGGHLRPKRPSGRPRRIGPSAETRLHSQLNAAADATLPEHVSTSTNEQGTSLSLAGPSAARLHGCASHKKKSLSASERDPWARAAILVQIAETNAYDLVVVDEFGCNLDLTRRYARAPIGERAASSIPRNTPPNQTMIASLTAAGIGPSMQLSGGTDSAAIASYIDQVLAATLRPGQIVLVDKESAQTAAHIADLLAARGCRLWFRAAVLARAVANRIGDRKSQKRVAQHGWYFRRRFEQE